VVVSQKRNSENADKPSGNWCLGSSTRDGSAGVGKYHPRKSFETICKILKSGAFFGRKMVRNAVHNALFNSLTMGAPSHAFRQLFNNGNGVPHRNDPNFLNPIVVCCATNCPARMGGRTFSVAAPSVDLEFVGRLSL